MRLCMCSFVWVVVFPDSVAAQSQIRRRSRVRASEAWSGGQEFPKFRKSPCVRARGVWSGGRNRAHGHGHVRARGGAALERALHVASTRAGGSDMLWQSRYGSPRRYPHGGAHRRLLRADSRRAAVAREHTAGVSGLPVMECCVPPSDGDSPSTRGLAAEAWHDCVVHCGGGD